MKRAALLLLVGMAVACDQDPATRSRKPTETTPTPLRQLGERALFGDMPLDNRFIDPEFAYVDGFCWLPFSDSMTQWPNVVRVFLPRTPLGQPAMLLPKAGNPSGLGVYGTAMSLPGGIEVSVWAGRKSDAADLGLAYMSASLLGTDTQGQEVAFNLYEDDSVEPLVLGDVQWRRFVTRVAAGPVGFVFFEVTDATRSDDLYLSSPLLVADGGARSLAMSARPRGLTAAERGALAVLAQTLRDRVGPPWPPRRGRGLAPLPRAVPGG